MPTRKNAPTPAQKPDSDGIDGTHDAIARAASKCAQASNAKARSLGGTAVVCSCPPGVIKGDCPLSYANGAHERRETFGLTEDEYQAGVRGPRGLNLYYVTTPEKTVAIIAAPSLEAAQEIPPYSNWRDLLAFGGWDAAAGRRCRYVCIAAPSTLDPISEPGVLVAGGMGFYSATENALKFY